MREFPQLPRGTFVAWEGDVAGVRHCEERPCCTLARNGTKRERQGAGGFLLRLFISHHHPFPPVFSRHCALFSCRLDEKIRKLDAELAKHKEAINKCRPGPAKEAAKRRALGVSPLVWRGVAAAAGGSEAGRTAQRGGRMAQEAARACKPGRRGGAPDPSHAHAPPPPAARPPGRRC